MHYCLLFSGQERDCSGSHLHTDLNLVLGLVAGRSFLPGSRVEEPCPTVPLPQQPQMAASRPGPQLRRRWPAVAAVGASPDDGSRGEPDDRAVAYPSGAQGRGPLKGSRPLTRAAQRKPAADAGRSGAPACGPDLPGTGGDLVRELMCPRRAGRGAPTRL